MNFSALLTGLLSGVIGAMGLGGGAVLIIYLAIFTDTAQLTAQGINLLFFIPIGILAVFLYAKKGKVLWKTVLPVAFGGLLGALPGLLLATRLGAGMTAKIFGGFLIVLGLKQLVLSFRQKKT